MYTCTPECLKQLRDIALKYNLPIHMHMSENLNEVKTITQKYGMKPAFVLKHLGLTDCKLVLAHCTYLDDDEIELLKDYNVSVDVMIGLPNETVSDVQNTLDLATSYTQVKHVSVYALKAEEGTPMFTRYLNGELLSDDEVADIYDFVVKYLKEKGYERYEVSNFAKKGYESKHNKNYWARGEYIGVGVGASSFINDRRFTNTESIDEYVHAVLNGKVAEVFSEEVTGDDAKAEYAMLNLRTSKGISFSEYRSIFGTEFIVDFSKAIKGNSNYLDKTADGLKIKDEYLYVQNQILVDFIDF
jgi:oxygen-independent coproporphyrinogen-3 oxidase